MIVWREQKSKTAEDPDGRKYLVPDWYGDVAKMRDAVHLQGPTAHNRKWRFMFVGRWKDAVVEDHDTELDAKTGAERAVGRWLEESGLCIKGATA